MLFGKINFETSYSLFDAIMTTNASKYTQLIKSIGAFLYVNRDIISGKNSDNPVEIWMEILNQTNKDDLFIHMKWNLADLPMPFFEDKVKNLENQNTLLSLQLNVKDQTILDLSS